MYFPQKNLTPGNGPCSSSGAQERTSGRRIPFQQRNAHIWSYLRTSVYKWNNKHNHLVKKKSKASFYQQLRRCGSGDEWGL